MSSLEDVDVAMGPDNLIYFGMRKIFTDKELIEQGYLLPGQALPPNGADDNDSVNHPSHYTSYKGVEVIQLTEQMNFNRGNAVKYIARAGLKNPEAEVEDLEKAVWYIKREILRIKTD